MCHQHPPVRFSLPEPLHCHSTHSVGSRDFTRRCTCRKEEQQSGVWCRRREHSKNKIRNRFIGMVQDVAMMSCIHRGEVVVAAGSPPLCSGTQATAWWPNEHCEAARLGTLPQRQRQLQSTLSYLKECGRDPNNKKNINTRRASYIYDKLHATNFVTLTYWVACVPTVISGVGVCH